MQGEDRRRNNRIAYLQKLAKKVLEGKASEEEKLFLDEYYNFFEDKNDDLTNLSDAEKERLYKDIKFGLQQNIDSIEGNKSRRFMIYKMAATIALLITISFFLYEIIQRNGGKPDLVSDVKEVNMAIVHGGNKAILTLSDGKQIVLDDKTSGAIARQTGIEISKTTDGQLVYTSIQGTPESAQSKFNTVETPRGGIYEVILPDGTKIWLNSATTLRYPITFSDVERKVELQGEAYFEVAHNRNVPFRVACQQQIVEVLGTHFNINAYSDEEHTKTTLLEGRVKVTSINSGISKFLDPGQQAIIQPNGIRIKPADAYNTVAWKNGLFQFDNENIEVIMRKISRWYNVDVEYKEDLKNLRFGGSVSRFEDIQKVLRKLELTNTIHFKIEERRILVMK